MLAIGAAVGVSSNFGAPIGGVLFSIEVTAAYFVVPLYWKCFFTAVTGAVVARVLYSWWHLDPNNANRPHAAKIGLTSMLHADDVSAEPAQLLAYMVIGVACGLMGIAFVKINAAWMRLRKRHARAWVFRRRYVWSTAVVVLYALVTFPEAPLVGHFMRAPARRVDPRRPPHPARPRTPHARDPASIPTHPSAGTRRRPSRSTRCSSSASTTTGRAAARRRR